MLQEGLGGFWQRIPPAEQEIRNRIVEPLEWVSGGMLEGVWASPPVSEISGDLCQHFNVLQGRHRRELHIQHLSEEFAQFGGGDAAEQLSGECPVLKHQGVEDSSICSGIRTLLLPLADLIFNGGGDHDLSSVDRGEIQAVEFGVGHLSLCGLRWMG